MTHFLFSNIYNSIQNYNFERDILGDVNDDGIVNILDIVMIINFIMGEGTLTVESAGDINNDEIINILDVVLLVNFVLGAETPSNSAFNAGDYNNDGSLNIQDIVLLLNYILN